MYSDGNAGTLADSSIIQDWYRAIEPAGVDLSITPPEVFACRAIAPVWLNSKWIIGKSEWLY